MAAIATNTKKKKGSKESLPGTNSQKGTKKCSRCHTEKKLTEYYISSSPLFQSDKRVPICKSCVQELCLNEDGTINEIELNKTLRILDKPYLKDSLASARSQFASEHSYVDDSAVDRYGDKILSLYFKNIAMRQDKDKSYEDSEKDGFMHQNNNTPKNEKEKIAMRYADINGEREKLQAEQAEIEENADTKWSKKDKQNMKYVISTIGYDPFEDIGLSEFDRKYCFNILAGYCDTSGIAEDGHKMQGVIEITMLYCQIRRINEEINKELSGSSINDGKISKLTNSKSTLLSSINAIAKDNNIASNYNKNSKQGRSALTSKMKEMEELGFDDIKVNLFDIKTCDAFRQIAELSNQNIANQLTLDSNEYTDIIKEQRELIQKYTLEIDTLTEENRKLKNQVIDLESKKR